MAGFISLLVIFAFYGLVPRYSSDRAHSVLQWLASTWNSETDYEHGWLVPVVIIGLIAYRFKDLGQLAQRNKWNGLGLISVILGALLYVAAYRTFQPRIAAGGLPFLLWGSCFYLWGWNVAKILAFPFFFFWLAIPLPSFQQATTHLQLIATSMAHFGSGLFGVETKVIGTTILPLKGDWKPLEIATGCSGIRSLMALMMISSAWAYVARIRMWQKAVLLLSAIPLAIIGNSLRVVSIFVIAEYGDEKWAATTWHDWSGILLFYPFSIFLLLSLHSIFEGGLPWKKNKLRVVRREQVVQPASAE